MPAKAENECICILARNSSATSDRTCVKRMPQCFLARFGGMLIKTSREYVKYFVITDSGSCCTGTGAKEVYCFAEAHNSLLCRPRVFDVHTYDKCIDRKLQTGGRRISVRLIASSTIKSSRPASWKAKWNRVFISIKYLYEVMETRSPKLGS